MAVSPNELRIGNYLQVNGEYCQVVRIKWHAQKQAGSFSTIGKTGWYPMKVCQPIPLTPSILEKCGFHKYNSAWVEENFDPSNYNKWYFEIWDDNGEFNYNSAEYAVKLKSLHQLQNLYYALTQTELKIQLP